MACNLIDCLANLDANDAAGAATCIHGNPLVIQCSPWRRQTDSTRRRLTRLYRRALVMENRRSLHGEVLANCGGGGAQYTETDALAHVCSRLPHR